MINHFFQYGQKVRIEFADKNKKTVTLNRTKVCIKVSDFESSWSPCMWRFKGREGEQGQWEIIYHEGVFEMRATGNKSFCHNGVHCLRSIIRKGDVIDMGYHRLTFLESDECSQQSSLMPWSVWPENSIILLEGETGTGKTSLAREIHEELHNPLAPFVHINLSSYAQGLVESEIFGHVQGAFTGAMKERRGAIEQAGRGTLFIDEVDSLSKELQVKLLTFLDNKRFRRVGGERESQGHCRLIFATGRPLENQVRKDAMRADFYYRLTSGLHHRLKPLREDKKSIDTFIRSFEEKYSVTVSRDLKHFLIDQKWPGNYRQLASYLNRKRILECRMHYIDFGSLESSFDSEFIKASQFDNVLTLKEMRKEYCQKVYFNLNQNMSESSKRLGITRNTLKSILAS